MRLAVISDTHGNAVALEAVIKDMRKHSPDGIVFLGDAAMRGPQPAECVELLHSLDLLAIVRGNYDHIFTHFPTSEDWKPANFKEALVWRAFEYDCSRLSASEQHWLGNLPTEHLLQFGETSIEMYHASPDSLGKITYPWAPLEDLDQLHQHENTNLVLYGHIHHAFVRQGKGRLIVNSGSVGIPFDRDNRASYAIVDMEKQDISVQIRRVTYDFEKIIAIAKQRLMPDVELFEYGVRHALYPYYEGLKLQLS